MDLEQEIITILEENEIEFALSLPCAKIKRLLQLTSQTMEHIPLTREEEGIGIASGLHLGNKKYILMMQSGGIGNSLNAMLSLALVYKIPLPIIISWRGVYNEKIEAQKPMGEFLPAIFKAINCPYVSIHHSDDLAKIDQAIRDAYKNDSIYGIFISPQFWEESEGSPIIMQKSTLRELPEIHLPKGRRIKQQKLATTELLTRFEAIKILKDHLQEKIVIGNIGIPSKELYQIIDQTSNFYMLGSFGMASAIGFGLAIATDKEVLVIDGDASILTNPNILGTIGANRERCHNLTILLMDNGVCGSTGNQTTLAQNSLDLEALARAYGFSSTIKVASRAEINQALKSKLIGPKLIHILLRAGNNPQVQVIPLSATEIKERFKEYITSTNLKKEKK
jgi:sulfopyruvate decarboxylase subunit beta